jgi:hypothetical protein
MKVSLNVLNHLGLSLYSNVAAVLSETVANSWDADAKNVHITVDVRNDKIVVEDDGDGMTLDDINNRYLLVGYRKRDGKSTATTVLGRSPMGRKGIGKLSLFSIAKHVEVHTKKSGKALAFALDLDDITKAIENDGGNYHPTAIKATFRKSKGTKIVLSRLKGSVIRTAPSLRRKLARRFGIIGSAFDFSVTIDGTPVTATDRDYYHKIEYLWYYGDDSAWVVKEAKNAKATFKRSPDLGDGRRVTGWIASVKEVGQMKDDYGENLNRIIVMSRGKLAQQDILETFGQGGLYAKYLFGEINADFLDEDGLEDIATSNRQELLEDDERFVRLLAFVKDEVSNIKNEWNRLRAASGEERARELPAIATWLDTLDPSTRKAAQKFLGKINQVPIENEESKNLLFAHSVLAFETYRIRKELDKLDSIAIDDLPALKMLFGRLDDIEATLYYQITKERLDVIRLLQKTVDDNALERVVQSILFNHLWLLDPSWDRATETTYMEERVGKVLDTIDAKLSKSEKLARLDIRYKHVSGKHVIIELKRPEISITTTKILDQVGKYRKALKQLFEQAGDKSPLEFIVLLGKEPSDWQNYGDEAANLLEAVDARIVYYTRLLNDANNSYLDYIERSQKAGRVFELIRQIDPSYFSISD